VCEHRGAGKVVDSNNFITFCAKHLSERKTTDTAEAVDCNFYVCHNRVPPKYENFYYIFFLLRTKKAERPLRPHTILPHFFLFVNNFAQQLCKLFGKNKKIFQTRVRFCELRAKRVISFQIRAKQSLFSIIPLKNGR
jgi:hypothetical protein